MSTNIKISVLTPLYKHSEEYVRQCLDSLCNQTLDEIEFILIDNGADTTNKKLIKEYLEKDARFRAEYLDKNVGLGAALNRGIKSARGTYIGFLESDDFIEADFYKDVYSRSNLGEIDIIKTLYNTLDENGNLKLMNHFPSGQINKYLTRGECTGLIQGHVSHWSGIYKKAFLSHNRIAFNETPGGHSQDFGFVLKCYAFANSVLVVPHAYVTYRLYTGIHQFEYLNTCMLDELELSLSFLMRSNISRDIWEIIFLRVAPRLKDCLITANVNQSKRTIKLLRKVCKFQSYKFFPENIKRNIENLIKKQNFLERFCICNRDHVKILGINFFSYERLSEDFQKINLLANFLKIVNRAGECKIFFIGVPLIKKINNSHLHLLSIFGCPLYKKKIPKFTHEKNYERIECVLNRLTQVSENILKLKEETQNLQVEIQASIVHRNSFGPYKNAFTDREVVLLCTGPTARFFNPIPKSVCVGVNGAVYMGIGLDFIFIQDNTINQPGNEQLTNDVLNYAHARCRKFVGLPPKRIRQINISGNKKIFPIPLSSQNMNTFPYVMSTYNFNAGVEQLPYDISVEPISNLYGTAFSAMQFILYTNPSVCYLVGCDCSTGYAYDNKRGNFLPLEPQIKIWKIIKEYSRIYFPTTKIKVVNPVGLKGVFDAVYTLPYINEYSDICPSNVELI